MHSQGHALFHARKFLHSVSIHDRAISFVSVFYDLKTESATSTCRKRMKVANRFVICAKTAKTLLFLETTTQSHTTYRARNNFEIILGRPQLRCGIPGALHYWPHLRLPSAGTKNAAKCTVDTEMLVLALNQSVVSYAGLTEASAPKHHLYVLCEKGSHLSFLSTADCTTIDDG